MLKNKLSARLRELRARKNYKQKEMAEYLDLTQTTYTSYENGARNPDIDVLTNIADKFDISIDFLVGRVDQPNIAIIEALPEELKIEGIKAVYATLDAVKTGLSADEINEILEFAKTVKKK
jgi:transcriptional regulator with XRE-family HTH domain